MGLSISVWESPALQGTILALRGMDKELAAQVRKATKSVSEREWKAELAHSTDTRLEHRVLVDSAKVATTNTQITLRAGQLARKLSGGGAIRDLAAGTEFGMAPTRAVKTSTKGTTYTRKMGPVFKKRNRKGYVGHPAAAHIIPNIAALWVQTTVRTFHEALEKGAR